MHHQSKQHSTYPTRRVHTIGSLVGHPLHQCCRFCVIGALLLSGFNISKAYLGHHGSAIANIHAVYVRQRHIIDKTPVRQCVHCLSIIMQPFMLMTSQSWEFIQKSIAANIPKHTSLLSQLAPKYKAAYQHLIKQSHTLALFIGYLFNIMWLRLMTLMCTIPSILLFCAMGLIDGLSSRAIRRAELGRESAFLFHKMKQATGWVFTLGAAFLLMLPIPIALDWILVPQMCLLLFFVSMTVKYFKKYL